MEVNHSYRGAWFFPLTTNFEKSKRDIVTNLTKIPDSRVASGFTLGELVTRKPLLEAPETGTSRTAVRAPRAGGVISLQGSVIVQTSSPRYCLKD